MTTPYSYNYNYSIYIRYIILSLLARVGFAWVSWRLRQGLRDGTGATNQANKHEALQMGVREETSAYWYLRHLSYIFIARNYMPLRVKGELDLICYDGETLDIVEVRTRRALKGQPPVVRLHKAALSAQLSPRFH
jgi:hypothetical protein